jgi:hypothetical protein
MRTPGIASDVLKEVPLVQGPLHEHGLQWAEDSLAYAARHDYPAAWIWARKALVLAPAVIAANQAAVQALAGDTDRARAAGQCHRLLLLNPRLIENQRAWLHFVTRAPGQTARFRNTPVPWPILLNSDPARFLEYLGRYHPSHIAWFRTHWTAQSTTAGPVLQRLAELGIADGGAGPELIRAGKRVLVIDPGASKALATMAEIIGNAGDAARIITMVKRWTMSGWSAPHGIAAAFGRLAEPSQLTDVLRSLTELCLTRGDPIAARRLMIAVALQRDVTALRSIFSTLPPLEPLLGTSAEVYVAEAQLAFTQAKGRYQTSIPTIDLGPEATEHAEAGGAPILSVLVPIGNRLSDLKVTLPSMLGQNRNDIEFIFSVQADRDGMADWLRETALSDARVRVVETMGPHFSKAVSVNRGAATARGRFLQIMDCDCRYTRPDALSLVIDRLLSLPTFVHSFGYRGMIAMSMEAFHLCGGIAPDVQDEQLRLAEQVSTYRSVDDSVLIGDAIAFAGCGYVFWRPESTERLTIGEDGLWSVEVIGSNVPILLDHIGESRVAGGTRQGRFSRLMMKSPDFYTRTGGSALFEAEFTKLRNFVTARRRQRRRTRAAR